MVNLLWFLIGMSLFWVYDDFLDKCLDYPIWARLIHSLGFLGAYTALAYTVATVLGV